MSLFRLVAYNTFIQIISKAVTLLFGITTIVLLTNYLGPIGFGEYTFALSFVAIFSSIADWGTVLISVKEASRNEDNQGQIFGNVLLLRLGLSFLAMVAVWIIIPLFPLTSDHPDLIRRMVILSSTLILIFGLKTSLGIIFQTKLKMGQGALVDFTASLLTFLFSLIVIKLSGGLYLIIGALCFANFFSILLALFLAIRLVKIDLSISTTIMQKIIYEALPMGGILILYSVYNRLDTLILQVFKGSEAVGIYGLSYRIYEVLVLGAFYLMNTLLPIISQEQDRGRLKIIYQKTFDILILGGLVVFVGTLALAPLAIKIIAWQRFFEFNQSIALLQILGLAVFVSHLNHLTGYTIVVLGKQKIYFIIAMAALFFNLTMNFIFIPTFSFYGAAWITVLTETLVFCLTSLLVAKTLNFTPNFLSFPKTAIDLIKNRGHFL